MYHPKMNYIFVIKGNGRKNKSFFYVKILEKILTCG